MSYDAFWCFTSMFYHRHAENVLSKGGHSVWAIRVISLALAWWGVPKMPVDATVFCRFVTSCIVTCQIPHHGVWEDSQNPNSICRNYHLLVLSCHSSVHMTHSKSSSNLSPSFSFTHSASDHPCTPPPVVPTGRFRGPWPLLCAASMAAPAARSCSTMAVWPRKANQCSGVKPQAPQGSETQRLEGSTPWLFTGNPTCSGRNCNLWSEVREFHLFQFDQNCIVSWFNGSHYRCFCLWRSPRLRTDGTFHNRKSEKEKTVFSPLTKLISTYLKHSQTLFHTHTGSKCAKVLLSQDILWCLVVFHIDVLPSSCRECFVKGGHGVWAIRVILYLSCPKSATDCEPCNH